jgi:D,D-heptose 1,7-bisphosphate phosphatase
MKKTIFLDRDGTINIEKEYLYKIEDFEFEAGVLDALKIFKELKYQVLVVTNQSGIARGYYDEISLKKLNDYMMEIIEKNGGKVEHCYYCPHHSEKGIGSYKVQCTCRKPLPGLLLNGIEDYNVNISKSFMIGDKISDIGAGINAGIQPILVRTGYGIKTISENHIEIPIYENLLEFALELKSKEEKLLYRKEY